MKKLLCIIISLVLIICSLCACSLNFKNPISDNTVKSQVLDTNSTVLGENDSNKEKNSSDADPNNEGKENTNTLTNSKTSENKTSTSTNTTNNTSKNLSGTSTNTTSQSTQGNTSTVDTTTSSNDTSSNEQIIENIDNGVLQEASVQEMNVPENIKLLGTDDVNEDNNSNNIKATVAAYKLDGDAVSWKTENDYIYIITSGNNRLVVINSKDMLPVANVPLAGKPAELNIIGAEIYISLPDLCRIDVYSKSNYTKMNSLSFEHEVSSFCIDSDYIYYSEHDQHCNVYKKNITTNELTKILSDRGSYFYQPKLYLNKQDNILYIGETGSSGSTLFYYDATTLQLKSLFRKNDYGLFNHTRDIFHVGNEIFWANYRLSDTNAKEIIGRYGEGNYGSVNFASEELVSTFEGIFLTDTYECVVNYFDAGFTFEYMLVTESNNIYFRARSIDKNIILGVNFSIQ